MTSGTEKLIKVRDLTPDDALYCQLAEEASELAQAALKMRRVLKGDSPTAMDISSAEYALLEELSDVMLCAQVLDIQPITCIMASKLDRWVDRLDQKKKAGEQDGNA